MILTNFYSCLHEEQMESHHEKDVIIFAAAGMRLPVVEIRDSLRSEYNVDVLENTASSGILARQISGGARADIFLSASKQWVDYLKEENLLDTSRISVIAGNRLVIVVPLGSLLVPPAFVIGNFGGNFSGKKIAIGDPAYVPAGSYARQVIDKLGWYTELKNSLVLCKDVSSVLQLTALGECDAGIVYEIT